LQSISRLARQKN